MGKNKVLTDCEKATIRAHREHGLSGNQIASRIGRSRCVVQNFLRDPENYGKNFSKQGAPVLTSRDRRRVLARASASGLSAAKLKAELEVPVTVRHVRRLLKQSDNLKWSKMAPSPRLTPRHVSARIEYATAALQLGEMWKSVIFSDEKKLNLDGPDGCHYYWRDLRKEPREIFSRNFGGGSLMIWAAISYEGTSGVVFLSGRQTSEDYRATLENVLLPFGREAHQDNYIFMQDNASIHTSNAMLAWFEEQQVPLLPHPALSPDLNPIENCWGWLARRVYGDGRQFATINELKTAIREAWAQMPLSYLRGLVDSMPSRLTQVLLNKGRMTKY